MLLRTAYTKLAMTEIIDKIFEDTVEDKLEQIEVDGVYKDNYKRPFDYHLVFRTTTHRIRRFEELILARTFDMIPGCEYCIGTSMRIVNMHMENEQYMIIPEDEEDYPRYNDNTLIVCFSIKGNTFVTMKNLYLTFKSYEENLYMECYFEMSNDERFNLSPYNLGKYFKFPPGMYCTNAEKNSFKREFGYGGYEKKVFDMLNKFFFENSLKSTGITFSSVHFHRPFDDLKDSEKTWLLRFNKKTIRTKVFRKSDVDKCICEYIDSYIDSRHKSRGCIAYEPHAKELVFFIRLVCNFESAGDNFVWLVTCLPFDGSTISKLTIASGLHVMFDEADADTLQNKIEKLNLS